MRAITFYCELLQAAVLDGLQTELMKSGGDAGAAIEAPVELGLAETPTDDVAVEYSSADALADETSADALADETSVDALVDKTASDRVDEDQVTQS